MNLCLDPDLIFLLLFTMTASLWDLKTEKIPNSFILCALLCGLASVFTRSFVLTYLPKCGWQSCLSGFFLPFLLFGALVLLRMMGGGDVKLLSVIGLFLGHKAVLRISLYALFLGAAYSVLLLLRRKNALHRFRYLRFYIARNLPSGILTAVRTGTYVHPGILSPYRGNGTSDGEFCFSVPIFLALCLHLGLTAAGRRLSAAPFP